MSGRKSGGGKYSASDFRGTFRGDRAVAGPEKRHKLACALVAHAANHMPGPKYGPEAMREIRHALHGGDGHLYYGSRKANMRDHAAVEMVMAARDRGTTVTLPPHAAASVRVAGEHLAAHKHELPPALVRSLAKDLSCAVDTHGHKVVDGRTLRVSGGGGGGGASAGAGASS